MEIRMVLFETLKDFGRSGMRVFIRDFIGFNPIDFFFVSGELPFERFGGSVYGRFKCFTGFSIHQPPTRHVHVYLRYFFLHFASGVLEFQMYLNVYDTVKNSAQTTQFFFHVTDQLGVGVKMYGLHTNIHTH